MRKTKLTQAFPTDIIVSEREGFRRIPLFVLEVTGMMYIGAVIIAAGCGSAPMLPATLCPGLETQISAAAKRLYPALNIEVHTALCQPFHRPMYLGKRYAVLE